MAGAHSRSIGTRARLRPVPLLARESLYVGIDVGKHKHVAGFVSRTLLERHGRFEGCPALAFDNTREDFRALVERSTPYTPLHHAFLPMAKTGHYHHALLHYPHALDVAAHLVHLPTP